MAVFGFVCFYIETKELTVFEIFLVLRVLIRAQKFMGASIAIGTALCLVVSGVVEVLGIIVTEQFV